MRTCLVALCALALFSVPSFAQESAELQSTEIAPGVFKVENPKAGLAMTVGLERLANTGAYHFKVFNFQVTALAATTPQGTESSQVVSSSSEQIPATPDTSATNAVPAENLKTRKVLKSQLQALTNPNFSITIFSLIKQYRNNLPYRGDRGHTFVGDRAQNMTMQVLSEVGIETPLFDGHLNIGNSIGIHQGSNWTKSGVSFGDSWGWDSDHYAITGGYGKGYAAPRFYVGMGVRNIAFGGKTYAYGAEERYGSKRTFTPYARIEYRVLDGRQDHDGSHISFVTYVGRDILGASAIGVFSPDRPFWKRNKKH